MVLPEELAYRAGDHANLGAFISPALAQAGKYEGDDTQENHRGRERL